MKNKENNKLPFDGKEVEFHLNGIYFVEEAEPFWFEKLWDKIKQLVHKNE